MSLEKTTDLRQRYRELSSKLDAIVETHPDQIAWTSEFVAQFSAPDTACFRESDRFMMGLIKHMFTPDEVIQNRTYVDSYKKFIRSCVMPTTRRLYNVPGFFEAVCIALEEPAEKKRSFNFGSLTTFINLFHRKDFTDEHVVFLAQNAIENGFLGLYNIKDVIDEKPKTFQNPRMRDALRTSLWSGQL